MGLNDDLRFDEFEYDDGKSCADDGLPLDVPFIVLGVECVQLLLIRYIKRQSLKPINPKTYDKSKELGYSGVKNNKFWQAWASKIVSSKIRQQYLFHYWKEHFWNPTINSYSAEGKKNPQNPNISLQNIIRSARAKNSGVGVDPTLSPEILHNRYSSGITNRNERSFRR